MSTDTNPQPAATPTAPTENQGGRTDAGEISSLANYMARQQKASTAGQEGTQGGEGSPDTAATPPQEDREQFIPRSRFDQVLNERNQLRQQQQGQPGQGQPQQQPAQAQQPTQQPQPQYPQFPQQPLNTGMQGFAPQQAPQGFGPTGMQGQQPAQPQAQPGTNAPDFSDPKVQKEWREKIQNNPVTGLKEFVSLILQSEGAPLLENFQRQISSQISPIQQSFVQQQLSSYTSQRSQQDPGFSQVAPAFQQLAAQAAQRGYQLTQPVLQAIEGIARSQTGMFQQQPQQAPPQVPFSENPGSAGSFGQQEPPQLTPQERAIAARFNMTPEEYVSGRRR